MPATAARLTGLSITPGVVTIAADAPPEVAFQFALDGPYRLVVDMPSVVTAPLTATGAGSVTRLRAAMFSPGVARLVIDLAGPLEITSARSSANGLTLTLRRVSDTDFAAAIERGRRPLPVLSGGLIVPQSTPGFELPSDMFGNGSALPPVSVVPPLVVDRVVVTPETAPLLAMPEPTPAAPATPMPRRVKSRSGGKPLVVIDAGHGGKDVGAISVNGKYEKDVTLAIARLAAKNLERSGKVRVLLTRGDDRFIPLGGRVTIARTARADLFISIHADAAANAEAREIGRAHV